MGDVGLRLQSGDEAAVVTEEDSAVTKTRSGVQQKGMRIVLDIKGIVHREFVPSR